jgi:hypothetical protein
MQDSDDVPLTFDDEIRINVFSAKNNKSVAETLAHTRYRKLSEPTRQGYGDFLDQPLGEFLMSLKNAGDNFYKRFLNRYGDLEYSKFFLTESKFHDLKGVYVYFQEDHVMYVGRCRDSMKKRINQGYGKIHPKNCYIDGQATNCHLNALITKVRKQVSLRLHSMYSDNDIERFELQLIRELRPPWNIQNR